MRRRKRSKGDNKEHYVALRHWMLKTEAWCDLDCVARCAYVFLSSRYAGPGSNNGKIPCSCEDLAKALHVSKATASRALRSLQEHGFIVLMKPGSFNFKVRHASEWRLTEFGSDLEDQLATKDFARWQKKKPVPPQHPIGCRHETDRVWR